MFGNVFTILLVALMVVPTQAGQQNSPTVQDQVGQIATGVIVEVKTKLKAMKKVTGRLGEVTAEGFEVQVAQGQKIDNVKLRFNDVKSVKEKRGMGPITKAVVAALATLGAIVLVTGMIIAG